MAANGDNPHFIALAVDSVVYAPLFVARAAGLFEELQIEFGVIKQNDPTPDNGKPRWLDSLYPVLKDSINPALLVVCDPLHAIHVNCSGGAQHAATIGSLVIRPATWMFDSFDWLKWAPAHPSPIEQIFTYPRGMTSDTLLRFCLAKRGLDQDVIDNLITNLDVPGAELAHYRAILRKEVDLKGGHHAIVTMDLLELLNLDQPLQHYIVCDFAELKRDIAELQNYPMTALVVPHAARQSKRAIQKVLNAVNIALELCSNDPSLCANLLRRHYERRRTEIPDWTHPGLKPLEPIPWHHEVKLLSAFNTLTANNLYPNKIDLGAVEGLIDNAWVAYRIANENARKPALKDCDYDIDPKKYLLHYEPQSSRTRSRPLQKSVPGEKALLFHILQRRLTDNVRDFRPHPDSFKVLEYLNSCAGQLARTSFRVIENSGSTYLCYDDNNRLYLRNFAKAIPETMKQPIGKRDVWAIEICGDPGCGKSTFVADVQDELRRAGFKIPGEKIDLSKLDDMASFRRELTYRLAEIASAEPSKQLSSIFVDEINKPFGSPGETVYGFNALLGYLQLDKGKEIINAGTGKVDLRNIVWFFAGAHAETSEGAVAYLNSLDRSTGGMDYNTRISDRPPLPKSSDPFEAMISSIAMMKAKAPNLEEIDPQVLFSLAVKTFKNARERRRHISEMFSNGDQKRLTLKEAWDLDELTRFCLTYAEHLKRLSKNLIKLS